MAKALRDPIPTSSIARLFSTEAANRAVSAPEPVISQPVELVAAPVLQRSIPSMESGSDEVPPQVKREFIFSVTADSSFTDLVNLFRRSTGTRLSSSHVARALCTGLASCMPSIEREARRLGRLKLPSNARGREGERERFEEYLASVLINGIRAAAAYELEESFDGAHESKNRP